MSTSVMPNNYAVTNIPTTQEVQAPPVKSPEEIPVPPPVNAEEGSNLLMNTLTGLALIATGLYLGKNLLKRPESLEKTLEAFKLQGGKFERGVAKLKDGTLFSGVIKQTKNNGDVVYLQYVDGKINMASKNIDLYGYPDVSKASNYAKKWTYSPDGKVEKFEAKFVQDGELKDLAKIGKKIKSNDKFLAEGGKFENGKPVNADGTFYEGFIVEQKDGNTLIKEFASDGKQISERLNKNLVNNADIRTANAGAEHYVLDETQLAQREANANKFTTRMKNFFASILSQLSKASNV